MKKKHDPAPSKADHQQRGAIHKMKAHLAKFHPPTARSGNRLKGPIGETDLFKNAVLLFDFNRRQPYGAPADQEEVSDLLGGELERALTEGDSAVFRTLARAADHVRHSPSNLSAHAVHVITARLTAAEFFERGVTPTKADVIVGIRASMKRQGYKAFDENPAALWTPVFRDAGLTGLPKNNRGGTPKKHGSK